MKKPSRKYEVYLKKKNAAKLFRSECYVCRNPFGKGFTFHHRYYVKGEKYYKDFINPLDYQEYIIEIVLKNPDQFFLLCHRHHHAVEQLKKFKKDKLERLLHVVRLSL